MHSTLIIVLLQFINIYNNDSFISSDPAHFFAPITNVFKETKDHEIVDFIVQI